MPYLVCTLKHPPRPNMLPTVNQDAAVAAASHQVVENFPHGSSDPQASANSISTALAPILGISWNKRVISRVRIGPRSRTYLFNQLLCKLRNSRLPRAAYQRADDLFKKAYFAPTAFLPEWEAWRILAGRYRLDRRHSWGKLAADGTVPTASGPPNPMGLASLDSAAIDQIIASADCRTADRDISRIARPAESTASLADHLALCRQLLILPHSSVPPNDIRRSRHATIPPPRGVNARSR